MRRIVLSLFAAALLTWSQTAVKQPTVPKDGVVPQGGFIPDAEVAVVVAEAVLVPVYGKATVGSERPFTATLHGSIWIVEGKVPCEGPPDAVCPGGAGEVWISKGTGQILYMTHLQ
jgi:hypothetical protein